MDAYVLMNLLNELRRSDELRGLSELYRFLQRVYKLNDTGTRMLDSTNRITLRSI